MKKIAIVAAASAAVLSVPALAAPGNQSTADGAATAEVVAPLTLTHVAGATLNFGTFVPGTVGGSVTVSRAGNGTAGGDVTLMPGSVEAADSFTVAGDAGRRFSIVTGAGTVTSGGNTMDFTTDARANHTLDSSGAASFTVGGTLTVGANQPAGVYTGSYSVTVTYN
ncbi:DUF4402 domain-containing protein [Altererythrobacter lauratis]|uniref:DUF4402 domain-containing protein n=1 Tax=Alteraurantiacibacter lauratis TaxID=2054627 RepID=A0ABV7EDQ7_9SPHN